MVIGIFFESLILAQDERWRRALSMQVERRLCIALRELISNVFFQFVVRQGTKSVKLIFFGV